MLSPKTMELPSQLSLHVEVAYDAEPVSYDSPGLSTGIALRPLKRLRRCPVPGQLSFLTVALPADGGLIVWRASDDRAKILGVNR